MYTVMHFRAFRAFRAFARRSGALPKSQWSTLAVNPFRGDAICSVCCIHGVWQQQNWVLPKTSSYFIILHPRSDAFHPRKPTFFASTGRLELCAPCRRKWRLWTWQSVTRQIIRPSFFKWLVALIPPRHMTNTPQMDPMAQLCGNSLLNPLSI